MESRLQSGGSVKSEDLAIKAGEWLIALAIIAFMVAFVRFEWWQDASEAIAGFYVDFTNEYFSADFSDATKPATNAIDVGVPVRP